MPLSSPIFCRWDWCRSSFPDIETLETHVKHEHIWPMKPMRKSEIALMRRMDWKSLHSSQDTDSSIFPKGLTAPTSGCKTPAPPTLTPETPDRSEIHGFGTFSELSSPFQSHSSDRTPASPAFEGLVRQDGREGLSAAIEMFGRTNGHKVDHRLHSPSHQHSRTFRSSSLSSGTSQEVVERQLTTQDTSPRQSLPDVQVENDTMTQEMELRWPTDDELQIQSVENSKQPVAGPNYRLGSSPGSVRGQNFRTGSLNVPLHKNSLNPSTQSAPAPAPDSQGSDLSSQPLVLQTQAPYFSQTTCWSQSQ